MASDEAAGLVGAATGDYLFAISQTRRAVSDSDIACFDEDIALFGRR